MDRFQVLKNGSLLVKDAKFTDSGRYTCQADNVDGFVSETANVLVLGEYEGLL